MELVGTEREPSPDLEREGSHAVPEGSGRGSWSRERVDEGVHRAVGSVPSGALLRVEPLVGKAQGVARVRRLRGQQDAPNELETWNPSPCSTSAAQAPSMTPSASPSGDGHEKAELVAPEPVSAARLTRDGGQASRRGG